MKAQYLAERIESIRPDLPVEDVCRLMLLVSTTVNDMRRVSTDDELESAWKDACLKLKFATEQHEAMTADLEELAMAEPGRFTDDQIWTLLRALRVQSHVLTLYTGEPCLDV